MFVSYEYTSYSKGFCLFMTGSLFIPFLAYKMLGEKIKKWDIIGILLGFVGMICLVRPWVTTNANSEVKSDLIGCTFGFLAAVSMAIGMIYTRRLASGQYKIHWSVQTFYYVFAGLIMNAVWGFSQPSMKQTQYSYEFYFWASGLALI